MIGLVDVGGTKLLAGVADGSGVVSDTVRRSTPRAGEMVEVIAAMLDEARREVPLEGIGLAVPGPFDRERGAIVSAPGLSEAWHDLELAAPLGGRFGCPVTLENDANCAALAEARLGAGRGARLVVYHTVSTGIGTGTVRDGRLAVTRHDTEGGHQVLWPGRAGGPPCHCGGSGCLEALASGWAIERRFGRRGEDVDDQHVWDDVGGWLGLAVVNATALLDCDAVVFGGGVAEARWAQVEPALRATVAEHLHLQPAPAIHLGVLGEERNLLGALLAFRDRAS